MPTIRQPVPFRFISAVKAPVSLELQKQTKKRLKNFYQTVSSFQIKKKYIWQQCNRIYGLTSWERWTCHYHSKRVILDILAVDQQNRVYNIEIQRNDKGAGVKRARYNSSLIDANVTEPGDQYQELNETYVIFITENDVLGANLPIYHVDRIIRETGKMFNDESHIIYVNSQIKDETALGKLMHDFACTNAKDMYYEVLADRVHYFKEDEKGVAVMCKAMEDMRNEAAKMKAVHIARLMLDGGKLSYEDIAAYTELTIEEIEKIASEKKSA